MLSMTSPSESRSKRGSTISLETLFVLSAPRILIPESSLSLSHRTIHLALDLLTRAFSLLAIRNTNQAHSCPWHSCPVEFVVLLHRVSISILCQTDPLFFLLQYAYPRFRIYACISESMGPLRPKLRHLRRQDNGATAMLRQDDISSTYAKFWHA